MQQVTTDRNIPLIPKKRTTVKEKFITLLMFVEENRMKRSQWVTDYWLEVSWKQQKLPSNTSELDCLSYFLAILRDESKPLPERETALVHLKCYYQDACYWATQYFWKKLHNKNFWEWEEIFDQSMATFESLEEAKYALRDFQPHQSTKKYVQNRIYYNLSNWKDKKIGRDIRIDYLLLDDYENREIIEETMALNEELQKKESLLKKQQERVLKLIDLAIDKIELGVRKYKIAKVGKSNLNMWDLLVLTYGLNLVQTGAAEILILNQMSINQATISRSLKGFCLKIQLDLIKEFTREIKQECSDEKQKPIENFMEDWIKNKKKEVDEVLKERLQERVFNLVIMPKKQQLKQIGQKQQIESLVRKELEAWCNRSLQISIDSEILPPKLNKKINNIVQKFVEKLELS